MRDHKFILILFLALATCIGVYTCAASTDMDTLQVTGNMSKQYTGETIVIDGCIEVRDNASLTFRDCNVTVLWNRGSIPGILVVDCGELVLQNTTLWIRADLDPRVTTSGEINVTDYGRLVLNNSVITCTDTVFMFLSGDSMVEFTCSGFSGTAPKASQHWYIEELLPPGAIEGLNSDYNTYVSGNASITAYDSELGDVTLYDDTECIIEDSKITMLSPGSSRETVCKGTEINILSVSLMNTSVSITGSFSGYHEHFILNEALKDSQDNLRLLDCTVELTKLSLVDCKAVLDEADLWQLTTSGGETTIKDSEITIANLYYGNVTILDSDISYLLGNCRDGRLTVERCMCPWVNLAGQNRYGEDYIWAEFSDSIIGECIINYMSIVQRSDVTFRDTELGNLSMKAAPRFRIHLDQSYVTEGLTLTSLAGNPWINMTGRSVFIAGDLTMYHGTILRREYEIMIKSKGKPVEDTVVELVREGVVWQTAVTDQAGKVFFNVTWMGTTQIEDTSISSDIVDIMDVINIRVRDETRELEVLSDTPLVIELDKQRFPMGYAVLLVAVLVCSVLFVGWKRFSL